MVQKIQNNILRRALSIPDTTPISAILIETGIYPAQALIDRRTLVYWWTVESRPSSIPGRVVTAQKSYSTYSKTWMSRIIELTAKYEIPTRCTELSKTQWKRCVSKAVFSYHDRTVIEEARGKSKCKELITAKNGIKREPYMTHLPKKTARMIFLSRCNMLPIKACMSFKWKDNMECRLCGHDTEDIHHLMLDCSATQTIRSGYMNPEPSERFGEDVQRLREVGQCLEEICDMVNC